MRELWLTTLAGVAIGWDVDNEEALRIAREVLAEHPNPSEADLPVMLDMIRQRANSDLRL